MLKLKDSVELKELEKYGFKKNSNFPDGWAMIKTYKKGYPVLAVKKVNQSENQETF